MKKDFDRAIEVAKMPYSKKTEKELETLLLRMTQKERLEFASLTVRMCHPDFCEKLENDLNFKAKVIASYVRANMEDFHCEHLNDTQMKELNPIIRNAIYTALTDLENGNLAHLYAVQMFNLPKYWEDCEYVNV